MQNVIKEITGLYDTLVLENRKATLLSTELSAKITEVEDKQSFLKETLKILKVREDKVKDIEDIVKLNTEATGKIKEAKEILVQVDVERNAQVTYSEQINKENREKAQANEDLKRTLEDKQLTLDEGIKKLAEDRKKMRADIIASLK